jgi:hypothetical protein
MFAEISTIRNKKHRKNFKLGRRAAESLAGTRGKCFFMGPISNFFLEKNFFGQRQPPPPQKISVLCPKKQISCPLRGNISPKKMTGAQQKISRRACWGVTTN